MTDVADPSAAAADLTAQLDAATRRLLRTTAAITDEQARAPSHLPGWTRGHVLTHLARNADGLCNLLVWARTGVATPQYASYEDRDAGIAAGAGRPAARLYAGYRPSDWPDTFAGQGLARVTQGFTGVLAWLTGRSDGAGLAGQLPMLPPW